MQNPETSGFHYINIPLFTYLFLVKPLFGPKYCSFFNYLWNRIGRAEGSPVHCSAFNLKMRSLQREDLKSFSHGFVASIWQPGN